jgi:hypothetical protein
VVGQMIRNVREYVKSYAVHVAHWPGAEPPSRFFPLWQSRGLVTGISRADGDLVAPPGEAAREAVYEAWYPPIRPGVGRVRRDVKDSQRTAASRGAKLQTVH